jgi:hypothetical protein
MSDENLPDEFPAAPDPLAGALDAIDVESHEPAVDG